MKHKIIIRLKASYLSRLSILTAKNFPEAESLEFEKIKDLLS